MTKTILTVKDLSKKIKNKTILKGISFEVKEGDCLALIGPNGAGKTSLMSCILGDKKASRGRVTMVPDASRITLLLQENTIPEGFKVRELITFFRDIAEEALTQSQIEEMLRFSEDQYQQFSEKLSGGQRRLLAFVLCLIAKPAILFLDEPTAGMDTSTRQRFWEIVASLKATGITVVYTSHYIEEVEHTADRILVLHQGQLIRDTTPYAMRKEDKEKQVTLAVSYREVVSQLSDVYDLQEKRDTISFMTRDLEQVWQVLEQNGCRISDIEIQNKSLLDTLFDTAKREDDK